MVAQVRVEGPKTAQGRGWGKEGKPWALAERAEVDS